MGYLDNSTIVVDAVLTKEGRRLLSEGQGLDIRYFTLSDSGIDYTLWNPDHPSGSAYYGEAIENLPSLEAIPRGQFYMRNKLITLGKGVTSIPYWKIFGTTEMATITLNDTEDDPNQDYPGVNVNFQILGSDGESDYQLVIPDARALESISAGGTDDFQVEALSNEDAQSVTYLQNIESADAAFYIVRPGQSEFNLNFKRGTTSVNVDASIISLSTGIAKTFRLNITGKTS
tara:strand:- start:50 stop:742 length:693 start_codon:yes stop_codon:yes gene_type:complete